MLSKTQELGYADNTLLSAFAGLLIGGLAGAVAMLLLAPQSGKDTRTQIQGKSFELRDSTGKMLEDTLSQVRSMTKKLTHSGQERIAELKHQSQELAVEQLDRVSAVVKAGKAAVKSS